MDGLNLAIYDSLYGEEQNAYFNSWLGGCFCPSRFVFAPDGPGTIVYATVNFPGSWHEGQRAEELYRILNRVPSPDASAGESAFNRKDMAHKIMRPLKSDQLVPKVVAVLVLVRR